MKLSKHMDDKVPRALWKGRGKTMKEAVHEAVLKGKGMQSEYLHLIKY